MNEDEAKRKLENYVSRNENSDDLGFLTISEPVPIPIDEYNKKVEERNSIIKSILSPEQKKKHIGIHLYKKIERVAQKIYNLIA